MPTAALSSAETTASLNLSDAAPPPKNVARSMLSAIDDVAFMAMQGVPSTCNSRR